MRLARRLRAGQVFINNYGAGGGVELPFGGVGQVRPRPREGLRGALRLHAAQDGGGAAWQAEMRLEGKTAIVTGGASGFGAGIVRKFCAEGARVMIADINAAAVDGAGGGTRRRLGGGRREPRTPASARMAAAALGAFGPLDILVNNAGVTHLPTPLEEVGRGGVRPGLRGQRQVGLSHGAAPGAADEGAGGRARSSTSPRPPGCSPRPRLSLVQRLQGLDDHRDQGDGGRARAVRHPRQRHQPGGGRDAAAQDLHGRGHAGDAREVPRHHPARPVLDARRTSATPPPSSAPTRRR